MNFKKEETKKLIEKLNIKLASEDRVCHIVYIVNM